MEEGLDQSEDLKPYCEPHLALQDQLHFRLQNFDNEAYTIVLSPNPKESSALSKYKATKVS